MKTIKNYFLFALFAFLVGTSSCVEDIFLEGNGIPQTESRHATGFDNISSSGGYHVIVVPGDNYFVEVNAESNLLPYIETDVIGHTLKIRTRGLHSLRQNQPIEVFITTPELNGLALSGSGLIETDAFISQNFQITVSGSGDIKTQISTDKINANVSGSGSIILQGDAFESDFKVSGSGKIKAFDLALEHCQSTISGSGDMYVNASQTIHANISGSGRVYYINHPVVHSNISGSGKVIDKN